MIYASIKGDLNCEIKHKKIFTMAGDHGVVEEGVSAFPQQVTAQMIQNFIEGRCGYQRPCPSCWRRGDRSRLRGCLPFG